MDSEFAKLFVDLPETLMTVILNKVEDVKTLFQFYSISEKMASLVTQAHSISIQVPYEMEAELPEGLLNFLFKFDCIESMSIRLAPPLGVAIDNVNNILRWRGDINGMVFLKAHRFNYEDGEAEVQPERHRPILIDCPNRIKYITALLELFPSIKRISSLDYANQGVIDLVGEAVKDAKDVDLMMAGHAHEGVNWEAKIHVKIWMIPIMELPLSGTIIKHVHFYSETNDNGSEEFMIKNAFPENELSEIVDIIMQKPPSFEAVKSMGKFHYLL